MGAARPPRALAYQLKKLNVSAALFFSAAAPSST
jgi:hypothetical protein